jgi:hypothetical protein
LQGLPFLDLFEYQRVLLRAVMAIGFESFPLTRNAKTPSSTGLAQKTEIVLRQSSR